MNKKWIPTLTLGLAISAGSGWAQILNKDPEAVKATDRLIDKGDKAVAQVKEARAELSKTLDTYNAIFTVDDTRVRSTYKEIDKAIQRCEKQKDQVTARLDEFRAEGDAYFAAREASLASISDAGLRARSKERMDETRKSYDGIFEASQQARQDYEPFVANLRDQWTYLGHDLNPSGITSLKPDAAKLNGKAKELLAKIDEGMKKATRYLDSLRSSKPATH